MGDWITTVNGLIALITSLLGLIGTGVGAFFAIKGFIKEAFASNPATLLTPVDYARIAFNIVDCVLHLDSYYKQQDVMEIYTLVSGALSASFVEFASNNRNEKNDLYSFTMLKAICELRLGGEKQYKSFIKDYKNGKYLRISPVPENKIMEIINKVRGTDYQDIDSWYDDVQYNIVSRRDLMFNIEKTSFSIPAAPSVSLDYDKFETRQSYSSDYEYCFADGIWKTCNGNPIPFTLSSVPGTLRVRKAASGENLAGNITTVKIYAQKNLSKQISARFNGVAYEIDGLSDKYDYQVCFFNDINEEPDWYTARSISGSS